MQARATLVLAAIHRRVLSDVRKTLAPFFHKPELERAVAMAPDVRDLEAFASQHFPRTSGFEFESDGAGGVRLCYQGINYNSFAHLFSDKEIKTGEVEPSFEYGRDPYEWLKPVERNYAD
jgi:hypothetical protein